MKKLLLLLSCFYVTTLIAQKNIELSSNLQYPGKSSSCWGYTAPDNKEYAIVGLESGVSIVDVSNPDTIQELFNIACPVSTWREMKTWGDYAYVTNETDSGLLIIDLRQLPNAINTKYWRASEAFQTIHTIFIDEKGVAYLNGFADRDNVRPREERGILFADLAQDPWNPTLLGVYESEYIHDCFARNDTLWAAALNNGWFSVIDINDKANPILLATQPTPSSFTHNCWLSYDGKYLFTTDEKPGANIAAYDVSDLSNIKKVDVYRSAFNTGVIPHNVHVKQNFLVNACYKDGVTIVDATKPDNLVEVGRFDTSPFISEDGFSGCWAVYPYFPSQTIIATDIEEGLFVLSPTYSNACYIEGKVTNIDNNAGVPNARVEIIGNDWFEFTDISGDYKAGIDDSGYYDIRIFVAGCQTKIINDVRLQKGVTTVLDIALNCPDFNSVATLSKPINFNITPNIFKTNTLLNYHFENIKSENRYFIVTDVSGKVLEQIKVDNKEGRIILGNNLPSGMYFVSLLNNQRNEIAKVIKLD